MYFFVQYQKEKYIKYHKNSLVETENGAALDFIAYAIENKNEVKRMKKMKRILRLVLVLVMAAGLAACGGGGTSGAGSSTPAEPAGSQGSGEGYELTMWLFQDWTVGTAAEIFNTWADEYIAQHPEVKSITFVGKPDTEIVSGFMAGGSLPDMFAIQFLNGKRIVESANILNLQPYYDAAPEEYKNALNADAMKDLMTNPEGTCWGLPFTANCQLLYRNLTVLEACGVDTSKRPKTLDELLEQFAAVQENGYDVLPNLTASDWVTSAFVCGNPDLKVGWENGETTITAEALARIRAAEGSWTVLCGLYVPGPGSHGCVYV